MHAERSPMGTNRFLDNAEDGQHVSIFINQRFTSGTRGLNMEELIFGALSSPYIPDPVLMYFVLFPYLNSMREQRFSDLNALRYATKTLYKNLTNNSIKVYFINGLNDRKACGTERCLLNINWQVCLSAVCNWRHLTSWKYEMRLRKSSWCKVKIAVYFEKNYQNHMIFCIREFNWQSINKTYFILQSIQ